MWNENTTAITIPVTGQMDKARLNAVAAAVKEEISGLNENTKEMIKTIIGFAEEKGVNLLASNAANVQGFANGKGEIFVSEKLAEDENALVSALAVFHEAGEAYFNENPEQLPVGVGSHTYLRGCGKDVRNAMPKAIESLAKKLEAKGRSLSSAKTTELVSELNSILKEGKKTRSVTSSEMALIDDNAFKGKNIEDWDKGLGDMVSAQGMTDLSNAISRLSSENVGSYSRADIQSEKLPNPELDKELLKNIDVDPSVKSMETLMTLGELLNGKLIDEKDGVNNMINTVQQFQKAADML